MPPKKALRRKPRPRAAPKTTVPSPGPPEVIVAGLGASAGGLDALERFFRNVTPGLGVAYVVVQHLDPEHASVLVELLQRISPLPVVEVTDGVRIKPDGVYVIPPNREMELFDGALLLTVPSAPRGQRMAVDGFFRSLTDERGAGAIGVILSGTGSDGARGLRAIREAGGLCLVQAPASSKFDGMPAAALRAVPDSLVAPAEGLPALLAGALGRLGPLASPASGPRTRAGTAGLAHVLAVLRSATGRDFSLYKRASVVRRVERRMAANGIEEIGLYVRHLREQPAEVKALFQELLINVTSFFRDPEAFSVLQTRVLARLLEEKAGDEPVRIWIAGCATGEEAYSIAILLRELMGDAHRDVKVQIYGTDLDENAIAAARSGLYPPTIAADISPERLRRFFVREAAGYRVKREIREQLVFAVQDLIRDPPFTRLDLVSCRNVFIYMEPELQERILTLFHYALRPGGALFLSPAEGIGDHTDLFASMDRKWRLFRAQPSAASAHAMLSRGMTWTRSPAGDDGAPQAPPIDFAEITRRMLLQHYAPASVLVDRTGTILFVHGETGLYLRPAPGHPTLSAAEMAREGLQLEIRSGLQIALAKGKALHRPGIQVVRNGVSHTVDMTVRPVAARKGIPGPLALLSFQEAGAEPAAGKPARRKGARAEKGGTRASAARRIQELTRALAYARENLQATIEEQQTSHEELQSANEELQSTNEEARASNEELETAKEELQSVNEELTTVNAELQAKVAQQTGMQDDMKNLFDAASVGTVFLDERLNIKRFTREAIRIFRLVGADVGRPLADIKSNVVGRELLEDAKAVLETLVPVECEVHCVDGTWYLVRILPYRTADNAIRGVVMTFTDISKRIEAEARARVERELAIRVVDTVREPLVVLDGALKVVTASRSFHETFGTTAEASVGQPIYTLAGRRWDLPKLRELLERILPRDQSFERFEVPAVETDGTPGRVYLDGRRIGGRDGGAELILLAFEK